MYYNYFSNNYKRAYTYLYSGNWYTILYNIIRIQNELYTLGNDLETKNKDIVKVLTAQFVLTNNIIVYTVVHDIIVGNIILTCIKNL